MKQYTEAEVYLNKQLNSCDYFADTYYYLAMLKKETSDIVAYQQNMEKAHDFYKKAKTIPGLNSYMDYPDKIYLEEIENSINSF